MVSTEKGFYEIANLYNELFAKFFELHKIKKVVCTDMKEHFLEFRIPWCSRERNDIPDVAHSGNEEEKPLESESETAVRHASEPSGVNVPFKVLPAHSELAVPLYAFAAAVKDYFNVRRNKRHKPFIELIPVGGSTAGGGKRTVVV